MNILKRMASMLLTLCLMVSLPISVQAVGSSEPESFRILKVVEMPDSMASGVETSTYPADTIKGRTVLVYFNSTMSADAQEKLPNMIYRMQGLNANGEVVSGVDGNLRYVSGTNPIALYSQSRTIDDWRVLKEGVSSIHVALTEGTWEADKMVSAKADKQSNVYGNDAGQYLDYYAEDVTYIASYGDAVRSMAVGQETDMLTMFAAERTSSTTVKAYFSQPIAVNAADFNNKYQAWLSIMDANNTLIRSNTDSFDGSVNTGTGTTNKVAYQWQMESMALSDNGRTMTLTTKATRITNAFNMWNALTTNYPDAGYTLKLRIEEISQDAGLGEVASNYFIDAIWGKRSNAPLYVNCTSKDRAIVDMSEPAGGATIGATTYESLKEAMGAARSGDTVKLLGNENMITAMMVPSGVTLDLGGYELSVRQLVSFGDVIDSTEGEGKINIAANTATVKSIILQPDNAALPLYDADGYRFFTYSITSAGTKIDANDPTWVKYGIKVKFNSMLAYELLANDANTDMKLVMNLTVGNNKFPYKFTHNIFDTLREKVQYYGFDNRGGVAITFTIRGLDALASDAIIDASPSLYSACETVSSGKNVSYEGRYDSYTRAKAWIDEQIENDTLFSFDYGGKAYAEHIKNWSKTVTPTDTGWTVTYRNGNVVAWSEITLDPETVSIEWTNYFKNEGSSNSPAISNIRAINSTVTVDDPTLTSANGSTAEATDFQPFSVNLSEKTNYSMATTGGRSSQGAFPYFDIGNEEYGIIGAIGWTGNWSANFANDNGNITIDAGMQGTKITLYAGEQMRTPMIMLQFFKGDQDDGHNAFRQLMLKSYTPADASGQPIEHAPFSVSVGDWAGHGEEKLLEIAGDLKDNGIKYECFWIDTGWFGDESGNTITDGIWGQQVGNWYFIPGDDVYPNGNIQRLSQYLEEQDKELLLWFEPERAKAGTKLANEKSDWMLKDKWLNSSTIYLYDFSDDDACNYMINMISTMIQDNGLNWYRQDLNVEPAKYWELQDLSENLLGNRKGMTEIKYITNLYRYLDELVERNPGLMIDNCAAGGRRLDLEMMKRSVSLWNTDYLNQKDSNGTKICTYDEARSINYNLSWWLPIHAGGWVWNETNTNTKYAFRGDMNSGMTLVSVIAKNSLVKNTLLEQYFDCRELMNGDYYILASGKNDTVNTEDACYEFYKEEQEKGYLLAFRPEQCTTESETYKLKGLDAKATYEIEWVDSGVTETYTGQQLMENGLTVRYPEAYSALLIYINKI